MSRRAALALAAAAFASACGADGSGSAEGGPRGGVTIDVGGVPVHALRRGSGSTVVLIHGASGNLRDWDMGAMAALAERHDVVAFDRAGLGASGWPGPEGVRLDEQARLLRAATARLGIARPIVVGHSYGGSVALAWALDAPETVTGLVVISAPSHVWPGGLGLATDLLAGPLTGPVLARAVPAFLPRSVAEAAVARVFAPQDPPPDYLRRLGVDAVLRAGALRRSAMQVAALKEQLRPMAARYPEIAAPVEVLHGTADEVVPLEVHSAPLAARIPRARLTRLVGIGHMPHHVALPDTLAAIERAAARV